MATTWFNVLYTALFIVGAIVLLLSFTVSIQSIVYLSMVGYTLLILSMLLILGNIFSSALQASNGRFMQFISILFNSTGPFLLNISVIIFLLYLMITYKAMINSGNLSQQYYSFSMVSSIIMLMQVILFYYGVNTNTFKREHKLPVMFNSFSYLLGVINVYIAVIIQTILKYYTTDG